MVVSGGGGIEDPLLREVLEALETPDGAFPQYETAPVLQADSIAAAVLDPEGRVLYATRAFEVIGGERLVDADLLAQARRGATLTAVVEISGHADGSGTAVMAYGPAARAVAWRLPAQVKAAALASPGAVIALTCHAEARSAPLEDACRAYGLTGLQTRVVIATIRTGGVRRAAAEIGVSFHTAREGLAEALRRVGVSRTPALVERITSLTFGVLPAADADGALIDIWGLSIRQAAVAALLASGAGRREAARSLGVSEAVVKKRADEVYQILQVGSAAALARKVVEARTVRWLTHLSRGDLGFMDVGAEPLQLILRPGGGRIAVSDYGPFSGRPVLVSHTLMSTRPVNRSLVRALQGVGWRPIAIDRPGYGLSDEVDGAEPGQHDPYATAAEDVALVMNALQIARFDLVVRVSAGLALALQARMPERLGRVVLVNPGLPLSHDRRRQGPFGVAKEAYLRNPALPPVLLRALSHALTPNRFVSAMRALVRGSPPDEQAVEDPALMRDYFRAQRLFATGRLAGVLNEQLAYAQGSKPQPVSGVRDWEILVGAHDTLHDPTDMLTYWRSVLPDAGWRLAEDAGRLMAFTHPQLIVAALVGESGASRVA